MMFYTHVVEKSLIELIAEFGTPVGNDNIGTTIPSKYYVELFCYCCSFFVRKWYHFHPLCEETLNTQNIGETLCL